MCKNIILNFVFEEIHVTRIYPKGYIDTGTIAAAEVPIMARITFFYCMSDDMSIVYK